MHLARHPCLGLIEAFERLDAQHGVAAAKAGFEVPQTLLAGEIGAAFEASQGCGKPAVHEHQLSLDVLIVDEIHDRLKEDFHHYKASKRTYSIVNAYKMRTLHKLSHLIAK